MPFPLSQHLPSNQYDSHLPLRLRGQNKYDYRTIFRVLTARLVLDKRAAQAIVPSLVPKGLCRNCKKREEAIYIWMRNTLPSTPVSPNSAIQEAIREKCIFDYGFGSCSFITIWTHSTQVFPGVRLTNLVSLMDGISHLSKWNFLCSAAWPLLPKTLTPHLRGWLYCPPFSAEA